MRPRQNPLFSLTSSTLILVGLLAAGCGDSSSANTSCSTCVNGIPVGPAASEADCTDFGESFNCETAVLVNEGLCPPIDSGLPRAACQVTNCDPDVQCPVLE